MKSLLFPHSNWLAHRWSKRGQQLSLKLRRCIAFGLYCHHADYCDAWVKYHDDKHPCIMFQGFQWSTLNVSYIFVLSVGIKLLRSHANECISQISWWSKIIFASCFKAFKGQLSSICTFSCFLWESNCLDLTQMKAWVENHAKNQLGMKFMTLQGSMNLSVFGPRPLHIDTWARFFICNEVCFFFSLGGYEIVIWWNKNTLGFDFLVGLI